MKSSFKDKDHKGYVNYSETRNWITPLRCKSGSNERVIAGGLLDSPIINDRNLAQEPYTQGRAMMTSRESNGPQQCPHNKLYLKYDQGIQSLRSSFAKRWYPGKDECQSNEMKELFLSLKEEQKDRIDAELRVALIELKNNLFEQQFGFERQICNLINKLSQEMKHQDPNGASESNNGNVKSMIEIETHKLHQIVLKDVNGLQTWVNTLIQGLESVKQQQDDHCKVIGLDLRSVQQEVINIKNEDRELALLEAQIQDLYRLISEKTIGEQKKVLQQDTKQKSSLLSNQNSITQLQEQMDLIHRQLVDKSDKVSVDSNFLVQQNEVDNLKMKVKFNEHKAQLMEEKIQVTVDIASDLNKRLSKYNDQAQQDCQALQVQLQGLSDLMENRFRTVEKDFLYQQTQIIILQTPIQPPDESQKFNDLRNSFFEKIDSLSILTKNQLQTSERLGTQILLFESDLKHQANDSSSQFTLLRNNFEAYQADIKKQMSKSLMEQNDKTKNLIAENTTQMKDLIVKDFTELMASVVKLQADSNKRIDQVEIEIADLKLTSDTHVTSMVTLKPLAHSLKSQQDNHQDEISNIKKSMQDCEILTLEDQKTRDQSIQEQLSKMRTSISEIQLNQTHADMSREDVLEQHKQMIELLDGKVDSLKTEQKEKILVMSRDLDSSISEEISSREVSEAKMLKEIQQFHKYQEAISVQFQIDIKQVERANNTKLLEVNQKIDQLTNSEVTQDQRIREIQEAALSTVTKQEASSIQIGKLEQMITLIKQNIEGDLQVISEQCLKNDSQLGELKSGVELQVNSVIEHIETLSLSTKKEFELQLQKSTQRYNGIEQILTEHELMLADEQRISEIERLIPLINQKTNGIDQSIVDLQTAQKNIQSELLTINERYQTDIKLTQYLAISHQNMVDSNELMSQRITEIKVQVDHLFVMDSTSKQDNLIQAPDQDIIAPLLESLEDRLTKSMKAEVQKSILLSKADLQKLEQKNQAQEKTILELLSSNMANQKEQLSVEVDAMKVQLLTSSNEQSQKVKDIHGLIQIQNDSLRDTISLQISELKQHLYSRLNELQTTNLNLSNAQNLAIQGLKETYDLNFVQLRADFDKMALSYTEDQILQKESQQQTEKQYLERVQEQENKHLASFEQLEQKIVNSIQNLQQKREQALQQLSVVLKTEQEEIAKVQEQHHKAIHDHLQTQIDDLKAQATSIEAEINKCLVPKPATLEEPVQVVALRQKLDQHLHSNNTKLYSMNQQTDSDLERLRIMITETNESLALLKFKQLELFNAQESQKKEVEAQIEKVNAGFHVNMGLMNDEFNIKIQEMKITIHEVQSTNKGSQEILNIIQDQITDLHSSQKQNQIEQSTSTAVITKDLQILQLKYLDIKTLESQALVLISKIKEIQVAQIKDNSQFMDQILQVKLRQDGQEQRLNDQDKKIMRINLFTRVTCKLARNLATVIKQQDEQKLSLMSQAVMLKDHQSRLDIIITDANKSSESLKQYIQSECTILCQSLATKTKQDKAYLLEQTSNSISQLKDELLSELKTIKVELERAEVEQKQRDIETRVYVEQLDEDMRGFCANIISDLEYMETKLIEALQKDLMTLIIQEEIQPLKNRIVVLEHTLMNTTNLGIAEESQMPLNDDSQSNATRNLHQYHQQLLDEMRKRRLFYLRKTPMDSRIEEIMKANDCSEANALQIYSDGLARNRTFVGSHFQTSPPQKKQNQSLDNPSFLQSMYKNIVDKISPNRDLSNNSQVDLPPWRHNLNNNSDGNSGGDLNIREEENNIGVKKFVTDDADLDLEGLDDDNHLFKLAAAMSSQDKVSTLNQSPSAPNFMIGEMMKLNIQQRVGSHIKITSGATSLTNDRRVQNQQKRDNEIKQDNARRQVNQKSPITKSSKPN